jgi:hypothetical protein
MSLVVILGRVQALLAFPALLVCITPFISLIDNNIQVREHPTSQNACHSSYTKSLRFQTTTVGR